MLSHAHGSYMKTSVLTCVSLIVCLPRLDSQSVRIIETGCCFYTQSRKTKITLWMHVVCVYVRWFAHFAQRFLAKLNLSFEDDFTQYNSYFLPCQMHKQTKLNGNRFCAFI